MPVQSTFVHFRLTSPRLPLHPRSAARAAAASLCAALAIALAGCATPTPKPNVDVPERFAAVSVSAAAVEAAWWRGYGDPRLAELIERAAHENRDIRIAAERVRAARASETVSRSWLLPSIDLSTGTTRSDSGYDPAKRMAFPEVDRSSTGLDVSWEIDLSGRLRAGASAASADARASADQARGVRLLVIADVATNYFTLVGAQRQLETVRAISAAHDQTLRLVAARQRVGLASRFDVERATAEAERARAAIPPLETLIAVSRHRIAVLIGDQAAAAAAIQTWADGVAAVPEIQPGLPAALLERRPDLRASREQLEAASFRRQQAAAEWFPRLFMGALFGSQEVDVNSVGLGSARFGNVAGLLTLPLLNWGRTAATNEIAASEQSVALLRYEDAIVRALEDVENALVALHGERQRAAVLASAAAAADVALSRAQSLYDRGQIDLLPLLDAQRAQLAVRVNANDSQTELLLQSVRLYKALGGGWDAFEPADSAARASTPLTSESTNEDPS